MILPGSLVHGRPQTPLTPGTVELREVAMAVCGHSNGSYRIVALAVGQTAAEGRGFAVALCGSELTLRIFPPGGRLSRITGRPSAISKLKSRQWTAVATAPGPVYKNNPPSPPWGGGSTPSLLFTPRVGFGSHSQ